jgi:hypothetical protein
VNYMPLMLIFKKVKILSFHSLVYSQERFLHRYKRRHIQNCSQSSIVKINEPQHVNMDPSNLTWKGPPSYISLTFLIRNTHTHTHTHTHTIKEHRGWAWWHTPVIISATLEADIAWLRFEASPSKKLVRPYLKISRVGWQSGSSVRTPA